MSRLPPRPTEPNDTAYTGHQYDGMTKREEFAKAAMQGLLADHKDHEDERRFEYVACHSDEEGGRGVRL